MKVYPVRVRARNPQAINVVLLVLFLAGACTNGSTDSGDALSTTVLRADSSSPESSPAESSSTPSSSAQPQTAEANQALIDAAWANDLELATQLIDAGADVNYLDDTTQSAFLIAASEGYLELLNLTLDNGGDVGSLDSFNGTGLIRAAERGHSPVVGRLLQAGVAVDHVNRLGWTALHEAILFGRNDERYSTTVRLLVAGGADVNLTTLRDEAPTELAGDRGLDDITQLLLAASAAPEGPNPDGTLLRAANDGDANLAALALRAGADLEATDDNLRTSLALAVGGNNLDVARVLVALGADPDALDDRHDTPWLLTGETGSVEMLEILLPANPDTAILNRFGGTSLIPASERGHLDYVRAAVMTSIDINHVNNLGWTALMEAVLFGDGSQTYQDIVSALLEAGADATISDSEGTTPLEHARSRGHTEVAQILDG